MALETVWSGSMKHVYLCIQEPNMSAVPRPIVATPRRAVKPARDLGEVRAQALTLLASQGQWVVKDLFAPLRMDIDRHAFDRMIAQWKAAGVIRSVRYGVVAFVRVPRAYRGRRTEAA